MLQRFTGLPRGVALGAIVLTLLALVVLGVWSLGAMAMARYSELAAAVTSAYASLPQDLQDRIANSGNTFAWLQRVGSYAPQLLYGAADVLIVAAIGVYFAISPGLYRKGVLLLVPPAGRERAGEVMKVTGDALWLWLLGQLVAMALVGVATWVGLWLIGLPAAVQLGVLAGLLDFIPYAGPLLAAMPAVLIGFGESPTMALWVVVVFVVVQQVENYLVQPLVQRSVVDLPPVLTIAVLAVGGLLFGLLGMLLATPITVAVLTAINMLYVEDQLGAERHFPSPEKVPDEE